MRQFKSFKEKQNQLVICCNKKYKHRSLKSNEVNELFVGKIGTNPILFRNTGHYDIDNAQYIRKQMKILAELREQYSI